MHLWVKYTHYEFTLLCTQVCLRQLLHNNRKQVDKVKETHKKYNKSQLQPKVFVSFGFQRLVALFKFFIVVGVLTEQIMRTLCPRSYYDMRDLGSCSFPCDH